jgi:hypothetical protein
MDREVILRELRKVMRELNAVFFLLQSAIQPRKKRLAIDAGAISMIVHKHLE